MHAAFGAVLDGAGILRALPACDMAQSRYPATGIAAT